MKDAVCDRLREARGKRPDVQPQRPDVPIWVSIHGKKATVSIDYAGESLHRRGYRVPGENVEAPLKEALAARHAGMGRMGSRGQLPPYVAPKRNVPELMVWWKRRCLSILPAAAERWFWKQP